MNTNHDEYFKNIYIHSSLRGSTRLDRALGFLGKARVRYVNDKGEIPATDMSSRTIFVDSPKASILARCPGSCGHVCCNYLTINLYVGCIIGCTYCIMKSYLNFAPIVVNIATERTIDEIRRLSAANPEGTIRVGTGEVGDSLDLDPVFDLSRELVSAFSTMHNVVFELKTKTDSIDHLLDIGNKGNAVIGFSVNADRIARSEDGSGRSMETRIASAKKAAANGFRVAFHFDPMFMYEGWEAEYGKTIESLAVVDEKKVAWISIGTFRYPKGLKDKIDDRWFLYDEFVQCADKKFRYIQKIRKEMYAFLSGAIKRYFPSVPVYLCMESVHVWKSVFGASPAGIPELKSIFERIEIK
jgi:spore photoproduct lyase